MPVSKYAVMPLQRRIAIAVFIAGLTLGAGSVSWLSTRKLVPLDTPVSLSRGHISSAEFSTNLDSGYDVEIEVDKTPALPGLHCLMGGCYETPAIVVAQWELSSGSRIESFGSTASTNGNSGNLDVVGRKVGYFKSRGGRYTVNLDMLSDASILNIGKPRLKVEADGDGYNRLSRLREVLFSITAILVAIGSSLLLLSRPKHSAARAIVSESSIKRFPLAARFSRLPPLGFFGAFGLPLTIMVIVAPVKLPSTGIWVHTSNGRLGSSHQPLVLRIDQANRWFLDNQRVSQEDFSDALKKSLSRRSDWVVCLDGAPELKFAMVAQAIDKIQGLSAKVVLVGHTNSLETIQ
jgi:biopolymer transport protein ExbD